MWILIDNYDSFSYILLHYLQLCHADCRVFKNDELTMRELSALRPDRLILSPGPETPHTAGRTMEIIEHFHQKIPILGVCLGHQAIGIYFGAQLVKAPKPVHGKTSLVTYNKHELFSNLSNPFPVMRYHSLRLESFQQTDLHILARASDDKSVMVINHPQYPCIGIQFHPESIETPGGLQLLKNWTKLY